MKNTNNIINDAEVINLSKKPPFSGYLKTWIKINVKNIKGEKDTLYILFLSSTQTNQPLIGKKYNFYYHIGDVEGLVGLTNGKKNNAKIVDKFSESKFKKNR